MSSSYLDYAMSVIVGRALPDVRDGLKPVHRRVLFAMHDIGPPARPAVRQEREHRRPRDGRVPPPRRLAIYDTLVRLAQDFASRYPLVDGQGNFGSSEFAAAAMRYTEARLARIATEMLRDIDEDTVDDAPTYDDRRTEPVVLPARVPEPAHQRLVGHRGRHGDEHPAAQPRRGHRRRGRDDRRPADRGRRPDAAHQGARLPHRRHHRRPRRRGRRLHAPAAAGSSCAAAPTTSRSSTAATRSSSPSCPTRSTRPSSSARWPTWPTTRSSRRSPTCATRAGRDGVRVVIELRRDAVPMRGAEQALQAHRGADDLRRQRDRAGQRRAAHAGPEGHDPALPRAPEARWSPGARATGSTRAEARAHILEGLLKALDHLDEVIALIRAAVDPEEARNGLMTRFDLTEIQARAILDLRLQRLTQLEAGQDPGGVRRAPAERIAELRAILGDEARVYALIREELLEIRGRYADERRTEIVPGEGDIDLEDLIAEEEMVISISNGGYVKRLPVSTYRAQGRGGKGLRGVRLKDDDYIEHLFIASTHHYLLFFTNHGQGLPPEGARAAAGLARLARPPPRQRPGAPARARRCGPSSRPATTARGSTWCSPPARGWSRRASCAATTPSCASGGLAAIKLDGRRRAGGRPGHRRRRGPAGGLGPRAGGALLRGPGARDGARHPRREGDEPGPGRPRPDDLRRARRRGAARRDRQRLRQAHPDGRLPAQGPAHQGRPHDQGQRQARASSSPPGRSARASSCC